MNIGIMLSNMIHKWTCHLYLCLYLSPCALQSRFYSGCSLFVYPCTHMCTVTYQNAAARAIINEMSSHQEKCPAAQNA